MSDKPQNTIIEKEQFQFSELESIVQFVETDVAISMFAGAVAGVLAKTAIAPLYRAKINYQTSQTKEYSFLGSLHYLKEIYNTEGFFALWRGNSASLVRIIPYGATRFAAFEQWRRLLLTRDGKETHLRRFVAGSLAGITSNTLTYPLDVVLARMSITEKHSDYSTLRHAFATIIRIEGLKGLYKGYITTMIGVIPYAGTSFFTYETLKMKFYDYTDRNVPSTLAWLLFGAIAGAAGQITSYPLDIVRRRYQTMDMTQKPDFKQPTTILGTLKDIYKEKGLRKGLYKGITLNWIKGPIAVGIGFSTYDYIKLTLREYFDLRSDSEKST